MKPSWKKRLGQLVIQILAVTALLVGFKIFTEGMYLLGIPQPEEVTRVTLTCPQLAGEAKEVTDPQEMELAVYLTAYLKYVPFAQADPEDQPLLTITYFTGEGEEITLSASRDTLWYRGKAHPLKQPGSFMKMAQGIFFLEETEEP